MDEVAVEVRARRPVKRLITLGLLLLILILLLVLWSQRMPIASDFIDRELARRGVQASYEVKRVGLRTQRLEKLVVGDPNRPDLTARWVEIRLRWGFWQPKVTLITARGVRLYGRVEKGKLKFGQVDRLLPPPTGLPFRLPDQALDVADTAVRLDTPAGRLGLAVQGRGNLADGFKGRLAVASRGLELGECRLTSPRALWDVSIDDLRPTLEGPMRAGALTCGRDFELSQPRVGLAATLAPGLDAWSGKADIGGGRLRVAGNALSSLSGKLSFDGDAKATRGAIGMSAVGARLAGLTAARTGVDGRYSLGLESGRFSLLADARSRGMKGGPGTLRPVIHALSSAGGTPVEPIGDSLAAALTGALRGFDAAGSLRLVSGPGYGAVRFDQLRVASRSGAKLGLGGGDGITYYWTPGAARVDGDLALSGGGFPTTRLSLNQPAAGAPIRGTGTIAPMRVGSARLAFGDIRFRAASGGATSIETVATLDGPFDDGRVEGLVLPIAGRIDGGGGLAFGERCTNASFRFLKAAGLTLGPTRLPLCPTGRALLGRTSGGRLQGGAEVRGPRLAGRLGQSPILLTSDRLRFGMADRAFTSSNVAVALGRPGFVNRLKLATLNGNLSGRGIGGTFGGAEGKLASVPLLLSGGRGTWRVQGGDVIVGGGMVVADEAEPARFYPLAADDFRLTLIDNKIAATAWLHDPQTGTRIVQADIGHSLSTGEGRALLDVPRIAFGDDYQPEELTRLTTGVIALVKGVLSGKGEIRWSSQGSSSTGTFSTKDMDLAATFGPVEDLSTTVHFTDLLGLASAPGQVADIGLVRAGIDVFDGQLRYQLLPGLRVKVESGRWPFAGGELLLDETILDFSKPTAKQLTFRVIGLDAARFVQQMEFSNISATGTFDGVIPMIFDERGGRIVGGRLAARPEGGTLSYIGELTDKQLGVYGKLAFDALKSLRYNKLIINLDGSLEGEFLAAIELDGVARDPSLVTASAGGGIRNMLAGRALGQLAKIPFEFNITVKGPFRALLATTRSLEDPTLLIQSVLPELLRDKPAIPPVQPDESETLR